MKTRAPIRHKKNIQKLITIHLVENGWVHTHGMARLGFPELEIKNVPLAIAPLAGVLLNEACDYIVNSGKKVTEGQTMQCGMCVFRFETVEPTGDEHYNVDVWELADLPPRCDECGCEECSHEKTEQAEKTN